MHADAGTNARDPREIVRRWVDAYSAYDETEFLDLAHPDIVVRPVRAGAEREYRGHGGVRRWVKQLALARHRLALDAVSVLDDRLVAEGLARRRDAVGRRVRGT
jgi:ketosteroid isomerase-like protein